MSRMITVTRSGLAELKRLYAAALKADQTSFVFRGQEVLVAYAKYLIEYLESQFNRKDTQ